MESQIEELLILKLDKKDARVLYDLLNHSKPLIPKDEYFNDELTEILTKFIT